jgi:hypothetical protein
LADRVELSGELLLHRDRLAESPSSSEILPACEPAPDLVNFVHLFMVSLIPFSTAWVADTQLAAVPVFVYAAVFMLVNLAYLPFEWYALASAPAEEISTRTRRFAKVRSSMTLGTFVVAMVVSLRSPSLGFGLICCALLVYLRPEPLAADHEGVSKVAREVSGTVTR